MKKGFLILTVLLPLFAFSQAMPNTAYKSGEKLVYVVSYGFINAGRAAMSVIEKEQNGKKYHLAIATGQTTGIACKMFKVVDTYQSIMDAETGLPVKAIRDISEDNYKLYDEVYYNRANNTVKSERKGVAEVPEGCADILSALYIGRRSKFNNLKNGDVAKIDTYFDGEVFPLEIRYYGNETIKTKFGKINCMKFSPVVEPGRIFDTPDDVTIWISNDNNKIPIRIQFNLIVGSVKCDLEEYENLRNNFAIIN